jgi:pimeloyl-ACP methyl ester carboxylesterase
MTTSQQVPATSFLDRGPGRIAYDVAGRGPLVVAVPGMGDLRRTYRHQVPALVDAGFRVATMDLRGHGDSDATFTQFDDEAAASDVLALVEHLGGPAILIGNSMGAGAVTLAAAQHPAAVRGLVLIGPFVRNTPITLGKRLGFRLAMAGPWATRVWLSYLPKMYPGRRDEDFAAHRQAIQESLRRPGRRRAFTATTRTSHAPVEAVLDRVQAPTLVVMGTRDPDFADPTAEATLVARRLGADRGGRLVLVEDAGHYPHAEFPERTTPLLVDFARAVTAAHPGDAGA